ncbi:MAG: M3 family metallopeptidase [Vicinamibacterales bacterium]|jgi:peptidyl-dipeptidase Dcp|nr:M3 family metallopeptidase [Vicinamibacterales bacterium]
MIVRARVLILLLAAFPIVVAGQQPAAPAGQTNPLLKAWTTPFGVPPFGEITPAHFLPAIKAGVDQQRKEIEAIATNPQPPTFANTIEAMEHAGELLSRVSPVFSNMQSSNTNEQLQAINREVAPLLTALRDDIRLNPALFARVKTLWDGRAALTLTPVQARLLEEQYKAFVRGGANLSPGQKDRFRAINAELSALGIRFGDNLLRETNSYRLVIEKEADLKGLPPSVVAAGADAAKAAGLAGTWVYTLQAPSIWPFLQYADTRGLRQQMLEAYTTRNDRGDQFDNKANAAQQAALRAERAQLLGYTTHADFVLEENMAKTPDKVYALLNQLWTPARAMALREAADQQALVKASGGTFTLEAADWRYYQEKIKRQRFALDEQALRPYFKLDHVRQGAFYVANRLYGLTIAPRPDLPTYHPEVQAFEVKDADGSHLGIFYTDYHPRPGKRVGAWSSTFRSTRMKDGQRVTPIVVNVCNFSRPAGGEPALLTLDEVGTLFHEFGHALNSLLSKSPYRGLGGFPRDFVEVPSQIMENWALDPEVLSVYAKHYRTGEVIPVALVEKIKKAEQFDQGFVTVEYLAACLLDMDWHTLPVGPATDTTSFERASMEKRQLPPDIVPRYRSTYFNHIFGPGGGYSSGYYAYIWSEVLDQDAFEAFREKGLFDQATARGFRTILEKGGTDDPMTLYKAFRGREPSVEPLLKKRGLK